MQGKIPNRNRNLFKLPTFLMAMHRVIGRVKIQNDRRWRFREGSDKVLHEDLMHANGQFAVRYVLEPAEHRLSRTSINPPGYTSRDIFI